MGYERYPRGTNPQGDYYNRGETQDYGRDYGSGRSYSHSSARDYQATGAFDRDNDRDYGRREYGNAGYGDRETGGQYSGKYGRADTGRSEFGRGGSDYGRNDHGRGDYGSQSRYARGDEYHGSYASDGHRWEDVGGNRDADDDYYSRSRGYGRDRNYGRDRDYGRAAYGRGDAGPGYGRAPQGYDYQDRGFFARAGDEVRSWFGDEDAERRREFDGRYDERYYNQRGSADRDSDYHSWRSGQIAALDRDYDEYRTENRKKFESEFGTWRSTRQTQRDSLGNVQEHAEVVGSDGSHVGTVDKVRGDRILLTKNDADAGGQHHSIPSSWITTVEAKKVTLSKTADEAKRQWRDEERNSAMFNYGDNARTSGTQDAQGHVLNRSFSGTYENDRNK